MLALIEVGGRNWNFAGEVDGGLHLVRDKAGRFAVLAGRLFVNVQGFTEGAPTLTDTRQEADRIVSRYVSRRRQLAAGDWLADVLFADKAFLSRLWHGRGGVKTRGGAR